VLPLWNHSERFPLAAHWLRQFERFWLKVGDLLLALGDCQLSVPELCVELPLSTSAYECQSTFLKPPPEQSSRAARPPFLALANDSTYAVTHS